MAPLPHLIVFDSVHEKVRHLTWAKLQDETSSKNLFNFDLFERESILLGSLKFQHPIIDYHVPSSLNYTASSAIEVMYSFLNLLLAVKVSTKVSTELFALVVCDLFSFWRDEFITVSLRFLLSLTIIHLHKA